jgi:hypothetical protein
MSEVCRGSHIGLWVDKNKSNHFEGELAQCRNEAGSEPKWHKISELVSFKYYTVIESLDL